MGWWRGGGGGLEAKGEDRGRGVEGVDMGDLLNSYGRKYRSGNCWDRDCTGGRCHRGGIKEPGKQALVEIVTLCRL